MLLCDIRRELPVVNEDKSIYDLYNFMIKHRHHIVLVKGEYGGTAGVVTMEDVLETLLGFEIVAFRRLFYRSRTPRLRQCNEDPRQLKMRLVEFGSREQKAGRFADLGLHLRGCRRCELARRSGEHVHGLLAC